LINYFTGAPVPGGILPTYMQSPVALKALNFYPLGNVSPSLYALTQMATNNYDQGGVRFDHYSGNGDQLFARYATASNNSMDPLPIDGAGVPGLPVANSSNTNSLVASHTHLYSPRTVQSVKAAFFRNTFLFDERLNHDDRPRWTSSTSRHWASPPDRRT
jgi:hypothetical protein